jgi:hypothetical protein
MKIKLPDLASALASWAKLAYPFEQLGSDVSSWGQMKIKLPDLASALASWAKLACPLAFQSLL